jgi:O-antigen/teichoic acid export membrane protein
MEDKAIPSLLKLVRGAGILFAGMVIAKLLRYGYTIIIARIGPQEFGLFSLGLTIFTMAATISVLGLDNGIARYVSFYKGKGDNERIKGIIHSSLRITFFSSLICFLLIFFLSEKISLEIFHDYSLIPVLKIFSLALPFLVLGKIVLKIAISFQKIEYRVFITDFTENAVKLGLTVFFISIGFGLMGAIWAYSLSVVASFFLAIYLIERKIFPFLTSKIKPIFLTKELLQYSLPLLPTGILGMILGWTDIFMLGFFRSAKEVGIYNSALLTASLITISTDLLMPIFLPTITKIYAQGKLGEIKKIQIITTKWVFSLAFPLFLIVLIFSKGILGLLFGQEYRMAYVVLSLLITGKLLLTISFVNQNVLGMLKKTNQILIITLIATILNIALNALLIPIYGIHGAAIATTISLVIQAFLTIFTAYHYFKVPLLTSNMVKVITSGIISAIIIIILKGFVEINNYMLFFFPILFILIYLLFLYKLKVYEQEDVEIVRTIQRRLGLFY